MSFISLLKAARGSSVAIRHEFKLHYDSSRPQLHIFVEGGEDKAFYGSYIVRRLRPGVEFYAYECKGKKGVLQALHDLRTEHPTAEVLLFFVDKDVDDFLGVEVPSDSNLFCTDVYSIENYVAVSSVVGLWLAEALRSEQMVVDGAAVVQAFDQGIARFAEMLLPVIAWILAHRRSGAGPNLGNIRLEEMIELVDKSSARWRRQECRMRYLDRVCGVTTSSALISDARRFGRLLRQTVSPSWLRGKFAIWFVVQFVRSCEQEASRAAMDAGQRAPRWADLHAGNAVSQLVSKAREPGALRAFLDLRIPVAFQ